MCLWSTSQKKGLFFFFFFWMKANLSQKALKLASNDNYFTEDLIVNWIQVVYFKLKEIWPLFSTAKNKKRALFLLPFHQSKWKHESMKANLSQKALKLASNDNYFTEELNSSRLFQTSRDLPLISQKTELVFYFSCCQFCTHICCQLPYGNVRFGMTL